MREITLDSKKLQRIELGLMHLGGFLTAAVEDMKADGKHPGAYEMMSADAEALADAIQIIRQLLGEPILPVKN